MPSNSAAPRARLGRVCAAGWRSCGGGGGGGGDDGGGRADKAEATGGDDSCGDVVAPAFGPQRGRRRRLSFSFGRSAAKPSCTLVICVTAARREAAERAPEWGWALTHVLAQLRGAAEGIAAGVAPVGTQASVYASVHGQVVRARTAQPAFEAHVGLQAHVHSALVTTQVGGCGIGAPACVAVAIGPGPAHEPAAADSAGRVGQPARPQEAEAITCTSDDLHLEFAESSALANPLKDFGMIV